MKCLTKQTTNLFIITLAFMFGLLLSFNYATAQNLSTPTSEAIGIATESQFIEPNEQVTVIAESRLVNLNNAEITWQVNGNVVNSGVGLKEVNIRSGNVGQSTEVSFQANIPDRGVITRSLEIRPVGVDLIWESTNSYTPAFYKGKALHPGWGNLKITALPHIYNPKSNSQYSVDELVYEWSYNNLVYGEKSGRGKNTITIDGTPRQNNINVLIQTPSGDNIASESITISNVQPQLLMYPRIPPRGMVLSQVASSWGNQPELLEGESRIEVQPYYFLTNKARGGNISYEWTVNGENINTGTTNTIQLNDSPSDRQTISTKATDLSHLLFPSEQKTIELSF